MVMSLQRKLPPKLERARTIAQLHEQAIAVVNDLSAQHKAIRAGAAKAAGCRKA